MPFTGRILLYIAVFLLLQNVLQTKIAVEEKIYTVYIDIKGSVLKFDLQIFRRLLA